MNIKIDCERKPLIVNGKGDEQFVNDRIRELREKRNNLQDKIYKLSNQLDQLEKECNNMQKEIDNEFLKQEHAYDLVEKYIQCDNKIYFVTGVERLFDGVKIFSNWCCDPKDKNFKFISKENALEIMYQVIKEKQ